MDDPIRIDGLAEFSRNLRKLDGDLPKALRLGMNRAADLVVANAQPRVARRSGRASRTVKARSTRTAARVVAGSARVPYFPWLDYGGEGRVKGRPAARKFVKEGRYVYAGFRAVRNQFAAALEAELLKAAASAGVEVD